MDWTTNVAVHESATPASTRARIIEAFGRGELDASLLYSGLRQTLGWVELHERLSPARQDPGCIGIYDNAFARVAREVRGNVIHVVSLACGDGGKDVRCLEAIRTAGRTVIYTPADISLEMVMTAQAAATSALRGLQCTPVICELSRCSTLPAILKNLDPSGAERVILFLGTIHNFPPAQVLRAVLHPLRTQDHLLLGANLAPAADYQERVVRILAQYDNEPTRNWLLGAVTDLGLKPEDGTLQISQKDSPDLAGLKRVEAEFIFHSRRSFSFFGTEISFAAGQALRLFYSQRFTEAHIESLAETNSLKIAERWISPSGEEGLFLCRRGEVAAKIS